VQEANVWETTKTRSWNLHGSYQHAAQDMTNGIISNANVEVEGVILLKTS
jgi:hypothetical protein